MQTIPLICIAALLLPISHAAKAQSSFWLRNSWIAYGIDAAVFDSNGEALAGTDYRAELWGGAMTDSLSPAVDISRNSQREMAAFIEPGYFFLHQAFYPCLACQQAGSLGSKCGHGMLVWAGLTRPSLRQAEAVMENRRCSMHGEAIRFVNLLSFPRL